METNNTIEKIKTETNVEKRLENKALTKTIKVINKKIEDNILKLNLFNGNLDNLSNTIIKDRERFIIQIQNIENEIKQIISLEFQKTIKEFGKNFDAEIIKIKSQFETEETLNEVDDIEQIKKKLKGLEAYNKKIERMLNKNSQSFFSFNTFILLTINTLSTLSFFYINNHFINP